jgi:hypothetical protein
VLRNLDDDTAATLRALCDRLVPGSARVWPEVYIDALLSRMPDGDRNFALAAIDALAPALVGGPPGLGGHAQTPEFGMIRALACEAFYSDFVAPGAPGPGAWSEIDFAPPLAARINKDWSYLGVTGAATWPPQAGPQAESGITG